MLGDMERDLLVWLLEYHAISPDHAEAVCVEANPPPWLNGEMEEDSYQSLLVPDDLLDVLVCGGMIEVVRTRSVEQQRRLLNTIRGFMGQLGIHDVSDSSAYQLVSQKIGGRSFQRFVSLTVTGRQAADNVTRKDEADRRACGGSRGAHVRAAFLRWIYHNPYSSYGIFPRDFITPAARPRVSEIPVSKRESLQAVDVLKEQKLIMNNEYRSGRVILTSAGVQCVEEYEGYWSKMTTSSGGREPSIHIGVLGTVTGPNTAIQSEVGAQYSASVSSDLQASGSDILALAARIQELVDSHSGQLKRPEQVRRDANELTEELKQPEEHRDKDRIRDTMKRLATRVSAVSALAEAVSKLWSMLFG